MNIQGGESVIFTRAIFIKLLPKASYGVDSLVELKQLATAGIFTFVTAPIKRTFSMDL